MPGASVRFLHVFVTDLYALYEMGYDITVGNLVINKETHTAGTIALKNIELLAGSNTNYVFTNVNAGIVHMAGASTATSAITSGAYPFTSKVSSAGATR